MSPAILVLGAIAMIQLLELPFRTTASHATFRLAVVNAKGEPAALPHLLVRWAIVWLPLVLPMSFVALLINRAEGIAFIFALALLFLSVGTAVYAVVHPHRGLHDRLLASLRRVGVRFAAGSYLFVRPRLARAIHKLLLDASGARVNARRWTRQKFLGGCGGGQMLDAGERAHRFADLEAWGEQAGVCVTPCRCKNPGFAGQGCAIAGRDSDEALRLDDQQLFGLEAAGTVEAGPG